MSQKKKKKKKKKSNAGRPSVMTEAVLGKLETAFSLGCTNEEASSFAGINPDTLYEYVKNNPEYSEKIEQFKQKLILKSRQTIVNVLDQPKYAWRYLERKLKNEFSSRVELGGPGGKPLGRGFSLTELFDKAEKLRKEQNG